MPRNPHLATISYSFGPGPVTPAVRVLLWVNFVTYFVSLFYRPLTEYLGKRGFGPLRVYQAGMLACTATFIPLALGAQAAEYARALVRSAGPDRLMWASDCPFVGHEGEFSYQSTIDWLSGCVSDATARAKIFGETALKFYFGGAR